LYGYKKRDYLFIWPRYNTASAFRGGEARVSVNGSDFYIDETGKFLRFADSINKRAADENAPNSKVVKDSLTEVHSEQEPLHTINTDAEKVKGNAKDNTTPRVLCCWYRIYCDGLTSGRRSTFLFNCYCTEIKMYVMYVPENRIRKGKFIGMKKKKPSVNY